MNWLAGLIFNFLNDLLIGTVNVLGAIINNIFEVMYIISKFVIVSSIRTYSVNIGLALTAVFAIKQGIDIYVLQGEGDPDADPLEMITRIAQTVATIMCGAWAINKLTEYATTITNEVASYMNTKNESVSQTLLICMDGYKGINGVAALIYAFLYSIMIIALIIMIFMAAKRAAELELFKILLPIMAINLLTTSKERWNSFRQELVICIFGYIAQVFCFDIFIMVLRMLASNPLNLLYIFMALGWLMLVLSAPKWLEKISYSSGVGNQTKGGARSIVYMAPTILSKIK